MSISDHINSPYELFCAAAKEHALRPFLHIPAVASSAYSKEPIDLTYIEALSEIDRLALIYQDAGYGTGHRVALILDNRAEFFLHWLALNSIGVGIIPVNSEFSPEEMAYAIEFSEADLVVCLHEHAEAAQRGAQETKKSPQTLDISKSIEIQNPPIATEKADIGLKTECAMLFTSGSTGKPKGCLLSNEYFIFAADWYKSLGGYCALQPGQDRLITPLPLVHMNALAVSTMAMIGIGGCIIQLDRFHPRSWRETVRDTRATIIHYLGVMPAMLLTLDPDPVDRDHSVRFGFGAGVNPKYHEAFEERFAFPLIEAWAMTESGVGGSIIANKDPRHVGSACFGKPSESIELRIVNDEGNELRANEVGELLVRSAGEDPRRGFFSGYYKNDAATAEIWKDGWLHTGDLVKRSGDGSLHFVDRLKNIIRRSGENISALEVETALIADPQIENVVVSPVHDDIRGDEVMASITLRNSAAATKEVAIDIFKNAQRILSYFKLPGYIAFVEELPLTTSQKPKRGEMRSFTNSIISSGAFFDMRDLKRRPKKTSSS